jgi:acetyl-CoA hydrolase
VGTLPAVRLPDTPPADLDLSRFIRPGDTICWGQIAGEPVALTRALAAQCEAFGPVTAFCGNTYDEAIGPEHREHLRMVSIGGVGNLGRLARAGALDVLPVHLSAVSRLFNRGQLSVDVLFIQVTPADADGWHSLGIAIEWLPDWLGLARTVIAEVNEQLPRIASPHRVHRSQLAASVVTSRPQIQLPRAVPDEAELEVARKVADLVPDGATVQFGIGRLPDAISAALAERRGLTVHSGLLPDPYVDLVEAGAIDPDRLCTAAALYGTDRLYRFVEEHGGVELRAYSHTHDPEVLAAIPQLVAINAALEIDLTGQLAAEKVAGQHIGAIGGQGDFLRGAARSPGGLPVIALTSTARHGMLSKIVDRLDSGVVTTPRSDVGLVVTEHGVADLRGMTLRQRAEALVGLAHPSFRDELGAAIPGHV